MEVDVLYYYLSFHNCNLEHLYFSSFFIFLLLSNTIAYLTQDILSFAIKDDSNLYERQ